MREMSSHSSAKSESSKVKAKRLAYTLVKYACAREGKAKLFAFSPWRKGGNYPFHFLIGANGEPKGAKRQWRNGWTSMLGRGKRNRQTSKNVLKTCLLGKYDVILHRNS